jgi:WD40 repeat protein
MWLLDPKEKSIKDVVRGHNHDLRGVTPDPLNRHRFATVGHDKRLAIWDAGRRTMVKYRDLHFGAKCLCWAPNGKTIAVGFLDGSWIAFEVETLKEIVRYKRKGKAVEALSDIRFSSDSSRIAVAGHDNYIDLFTAIIPTDYKGPEGTNPGEDGKRTEEQRDAILAAGYCPQKYKFFKRLRGHSSYVTHVDWSTCGDFLQSTCGGYEVLYWNAREGTQIRSTMDSVEADTDWDTFTCILGFPVMGIWPDASDGTDVNALNVTEDGKYVVTADDFGGVKIFNAPCVVEDAPWYRANGHSSHVMNIRFLLGEERCVSVGGHDHSIFQWKLIDASGDKLKDWHFTQTGCGMPCELDGDVR